MVNIVCMVSRCIRHGMCVSAIVRMEIGRFQGICPGFMELAGFAVYVQVIIGHDIAAPGFGAVRAFRNFH